MPTYNVTDPVTGIKLALTGDSPPSEAELNEIFRSMGPKKQKTPVQKIATAVAPYARPALELGGGAVGSLLGATGGTLTTIPAGGVGIVPGAVAGGALGYAAGRQGANFIDSLTGDYENKPLLEKIANAGKDVVVGSAMELGGPLAAKGIGKLVEKPVGSLIERGVNKAIRPSVVGKQTAAQNTKYMDHAKEAVNEILKNRKSLTLTTESGNKINGGIPRNLNQFAEAIEQTKSAVFKEYDAMNKAAGGKGAVIDLNPVADELEKVATSKIMRTHSPEVAEYAAKKAEILRSTGTHTMEEAQEAVKLYNESLKSFYRNPSYETANRAAVDAAVVNNLRKQLDTVIAKEVGPGYQELKRAYGALKSVEKDVIHRAVINARKNTKGLIDFTDVMTSGDIIAGIATMNPALGFRGAAGRVAKETYKRMNDPDIIVREMFKGVEKANTARFMKPSRPVSNIAGKMATYGVTRKF